MTGRSRIPTPLLYCFLDSSLTLVPVYSRAGARHQLLASAAPRAGYCPRCRACHSHCRPAIIQVRCAAKTRICFVGPFIPFPIHTAASLICSEPSHLFLCVVLPIPTMLLASSFFFPEPRRAFLCVLFPLFHDNFDVHPFAFSFRSHGFLRVSPFFHSQPRCPIPLTLSVH